MKILLYFSLLILLISCESCTQFNNVSINKADIKKLRNKYSSEAFNYFYEIGFYDEGNKEMVPIQKWKTDIKYFIKGTTLKNDTCYVENCIRKLNNLNLPIKFSLVNYIKDSNVIIYFGNRNDLKNLNIIPEATGMAHMFSKDGIIYKGEVAILNEVIKPTEREAVILEEMTQIIGSCDDSFSYPNSVFYQGGNSPLDFTKLDIEVIKLAYDPLIPVNYQLEQYEKDFGNILNYVNTSIKLKKYIVENKISKQTLEEIINTCYIKEGFYKHPKFIPIYLTGFNTSDSVFVQKSINSINKISKNLFLKLTKKSELNPESGIDITLNLNENQDSDTQTSISNGMGKLFKPKRFESIVSITYKSSIDINKKQSVILKSIYKSLGPVETEEFDKNWFVYKNDEIMISKKYTDILKTIYHDEFVDGFDIDQLEDLINDL